MNGTLGPFIKIFKMNAQNLLIWLILFILVLLSATNLLLIISAEKPHLNDSCTEYYECFKILLEGSVGEVNFSGFDTWDGYLLYMSFIIILMVLFFSMLIAMMTTTFNTVAEQGDLHYFKEIFDLRYSYKIDSKYGILGSLEYPFSVLLILYLIPMTICEALDKRASIKAANSSLAKKNKDNRMYLKSQDFKCSCFRIFITST